MGTYKQILSRELIYLYWYVQSALELCSTFSIGIYKYSLNRHYSTGAGSRYIDYINSH